MPDAWRTVIVKDQALKDRLDKIQAEHNLFIVMMPAYFAGEDGLALAWKDTEEPAVIVRLSDFEDEQEALVHLAKAWEVGFDTAVESSAGETRH